MRRIIVPSVFVVTAVVAAFLASAFAEDIQPAQKSALVKDEIILPRGPGEYMEVRHIILKGTNEEIGRAMGDIAQKDYGAAKLNQYAEPSYAKARLEYMCRNNPILLEWMKGIARSYGVSLSDTLLDTSYLPSFYTTPQCSGMLVPAAYSANGHTFYSASRDYYLATFSEVMEKKPRPGEKKIFSEAAVVEIYPDKGYSSLLVAIGDLTYGVDIVNSEGLSVSGFEDDTYGITRTQKDASRATGLSLSQAMMLIANTCVTMDEAIQVLLINKISMPSMPMHIQVADRTGQAVIYEISPNDFSGQFVYNDGKPQVVTNHGVYAYPDVSKMPVNEKDPYDTYNRYRRLDNFVASHKGKFSITDGWKAMDLVIGAVPEASEANYLKLPLRTFYQIVVDKEERAIQVKFYLKDKSVDPVTGYAELIFSKPFEFKLRSTIDR
ncbi:MAG: C45 family autoproteolytic acyltransferase/hydrolase [Candidatus Omnitrophica bacterium]|nr:C45 family autoproteolytic acyltransferase/hydrolase [Candidatus Omnitrophota bacterium]